MKSHLDFNIGLQQAIFLFQKMGDFGLHLRVPACFFQYRLTSPNKLYSCETVAADVLSSSRPTQMYLKCCR